MPPWWKQAATIDTIATIHSLHAQDICAVHNVGVVQIVGTVKNGGVMKHAAMVETCRHHSYYCYHS
jgi:hypothetical protein